MSIVWLESVWLESKVVYKARGLESDADKAAADGRLGVFCIGGFDKIGYFDAAEQIFDAVVEALRRGSLMVQWPARSQAP